jgi:DNA-binding response OmpR family regulator
MCNLLFVDDDEVLLEEAKVYFKMHGYDIDVTPNGEKALQLIQSKGYDCIILDIKLPDIDGFEVCEKMRQFISKPIIMLSNYTEFDDRIYGLKLGADDYVCKPFSFEELNMRIQLRIQGNYANRKPEVIHIGKLAINTGTYQVIYEDKCIDLARIEFEILMLLINQPGKIYSYEQIYDAIWKEPLNKSRHTLQARVADVRLKLNSITHKKYIQTVRGKGYRFVDNPNKDE